MKGLEHIGKKRPSSKKGGEDYNYVDLSGYLSQNLSVRPYRKPLRF